MVKKALRMTSATGTCTTNKPLPNMSKFKASGGFTLMEIMLVAFLMGLAAMMIVPNITSSDSSKLEYEAKRFVALLELLSEEAIMSGKDFGLLIDNSSYQFLALSDGQNWQTIEDDKLFKHIELGELARLKLKLDGFSWGQEETKGRDLDLFSDKLFEEDFIEEDEEKKLKPQIFLFASGELSAFTLSFELSNVEEPEVLYKAVAQSSGQILLLSPEDEKWQEY